ncbi:MAG: zinc ABC transporter solute-binding protein [Anaerolineae bacterium]|nr:zinc ABC transporter solute-binding protein [Anaerolineae bacterium]
MKKVFNIVLPAFFSLTLALAACTPNAPAPGGKPSVLAVQSFLADIAQNVAGDRLQVETLIPLGVDPHAFEPTPQDVVKIANSQVLIVNGGGFEEWLDAVLQNAGGKRQVITASAGLQSRSAREGEEAVMPAAEKAQLLCAELGKAPQPSATLTASTDRAQAALLTVAHETAPSPVGVDLEALEGAAFHGGYLRLQISEAGEYLLAVDGDGHVTPRTLKEVELAVEEKLTLTDCAGLTQAQVLDLPEGEILLEFNRWQPGHITLLAAALGGHHHDAGDPHFWLDPLLVIRYVENIRDGLIAADPQGKDIYTRNAESYIAKLRALDADIRQQIERIPPERRLLVTNHESFGYFADRYGLRIIGTIIPSVSTGAAPSAQQMARLVDHIRSSGAPAIFLETGSNPQLAQQIAAESGVTVVTDLYTHSITPPDGAAPTYLQMMAHNAKRIAEALSTAP